MSTKQEYKEWLENNNRDFLKPINYIKELESTNEQLQEDKNFLIEEYNKIVIEKHELKAMLKSISDVSMGKIKFDIDELLAKNS